MKKQVKIIDLFAGPGGLGEGFSSLENSPFQIGVSVEFEKNAHKTLKLRSFYRKLATSTKLDAYYAYIKSTSSTENRKNYERMIANHPDEWREAEEETFEERHALGNQEKWDKIKKGIPLTEDDHKETVQEKEIFDKVNEIRELQRGKGPIIIIGGPPCQAYSVNGRNRIKAEENYTPENDERFFLYEEYLKIIDRAEPDLFIMENVEGILSAKLATGERIFERIMRGLIRPENSPENQYDIYSLVCKPDEWTDDKRPIYKNNKSFVITANNFGVPQRRKRVILAGIKRKHGSIDMFMQPWKCKPPSVGELIGLLPKLKSSINRGAKDCTVPQETSWVENWENNRNELIGILSSNVQANLVVDRLLELEEKKSNSKNRKSRKELKSEVSGSFHKTRSVLERTKLDNNAASMDEGSFLFVGSNSNSFSGDFFFQHEKLAKWMNRDAQLNGIPNHHTRKHNNGDLQRYMFSAAWAKAHNDENSPSPKSKNFPFALSPNHKNWESGSNADRFRTIEADQIPLTITGHLKKDGHAQIHYDISQNRSLTVREVARIQTFPDDYYFEGSQGSQYQQVGNAVPPFLALQIARHVREILKDKGLLEDN